MLLRDWLIREKISQANLSRVLDVGTGSISNAVTGRNSISTPIALKIVEITKGVVSLDEAMFPLDFIEKGENGSIQTRSVPKRKKSISKEKFKLLDSYKNKPIKRKRLTATNFKIELKNVVDACNLEISLLRAKVVFLEGSVNSILLGIQKDTNNNLET